MIRARTNRRKIVRRQWRWPKLGINWRAMLIPPAVALALAVLLPLGREALDRPVGALVVEGPFQRVTAVQVQAAAAEGMQGGFLSLDLEELRNRVATLDWVDSVRASRVWPDVVRVRITEHQAAASWGETGLLNIRGELFTQNARHPYAELPRLSGPAGSEQDVARLYLAVRGRLADAQLTLDSLSMDARGAVEVVLGGGQRIKLGRHEVDARLERFFAVVAPALSGEIGRVEYVDLRYTNGFAIGWEAEADRALAQVAETGNRG
jgi:cell division protein FtsQ